MPSFGTILVALDFSDCSRELLEHAISLAGPSTRLVLLHVSELPHGLSPHAALFGGQAASETAIEFLMRRSRERMSQFAESFGVDASRTDLVVASGSTAEVIVEQAIERGVELIVLGTHGRRGLAKAVGGSIAAEVVSRAKCPVFVLPTRHKQTCSARGCDVCDGHLTSELRQLMVEREG